MCIYAELASSPGLPPQTSCTHNLSCVTLVGKAWERGYTAFLANTQMSLTTKTEFKTGVGAAPERQCELPEGPEKEEAEEDRPEQNHMLGQGNGQDGPSAERGGGGEDGRGGEGVREKIQNWGQGDSLFCLAAECKETHPNLMSIKTSQMMATKISHENRPMRAFLSLFVCARQRGRWI